MLPLQKLLNKRNRSIKSLEEQIEKNTEKIKQLINKIPFKKGRAKKTETKRIKNQNQRKKLNVENDKNKFKLNKSRKKSKNTLNTKKKYQKYLNLKALRLLWIDSTN